MGVGIALNTHRLVTFRNLSHFKRFPFTPDSLRTTKPPSISRCNLEFFRGFSFRDMATCSTPPPQPPPSAFAVKEKIELTEKENQIFERLLQVVRHFRLKTQLRVAGGWVRDKLLGKECYDIDIALDDMLGREFCEKVNEYLIHKGEQKQGIGVIQCNPDQSKHLETARMRLFDIWIDFVNLRCEDYSENSRIPTMKFGTAKEDADRRDLTINSLFYNINTNLVEDFTGRGLQDLKAGVIVTPLPPKETFLDDPLRVLRAIRFGARFGFVLDEKLKEAAFSDEVKAAIANKISRERIGHEIDLMVSGNQPVKAISYVCDLQLFWVVFSVTPEAESATSEGRGRLCVAYMDAAWELLQRVGCLKFNDDQRRLCLYGALFLPLREVSYTDNKGKKAPLVNHIFRNSLKLKASDADTVINLHTSSERFKSLIPLMAKNVAIENAEVGYIGENFDLPVASKQRILAGPLLRQIKGFWRVSLLISMLIYRTDTNHTGLLLDSHFELDESKDLYEKIESTITEIDLDNVWEKKPLVNGKEIMTILQLNPGPQVKGWQKKVLDWQLAYPSGTAEECIDWIRHTKSKQAKLDVQPDQEPQLE